MDESAKSNPGTAFSSPKLFARKGSSSGQLELAVMHVRAYSENQPRTPWEPFESSESKGGRGGGRRITSTSALVE